MTIICALRVGGQTWIGSDTRVMGGTAIYPAPIQKWVVNASGALGVAGQGYMLSLVRLHLATRIGAPVDEIADGLRALQKEYEFNDDKDRGPKAYGQSFIYATEAGIWDIDSASASLEMPEGKLWARGSGSDYALGTDFAIRRRLEEAGTSDSDVNPIWPMAEYRVETALQAACEFDAGCGAPLFIHRLGGKI